MLEIVRREPIPGAVSEGLSAMVLGGSFDTYVPLPGTPSLQPSLSRVPGQL